MALEKKAPATLLTQSQVFGEQAKTVYSVFGSLLLKYLKGNARCIGKEARDELF